MIGRNTVFVLGAGAHKPYGFPIGSELVRNVIELLPVASGLNTSFSQLVLDLYRSGPVSHQALLDFRVALNGSGHTSIDSFLLTNAGRPGFSEIGKLAIAYSVAIGFAERFLPRLHFPRLDVVSIFQHAKRLPFGRNIAPEQPNIIYLV